MNTKINPSKIRLSHTLVEFECETFIVTGTHIDQLTGEKFLELRSTFSGPRSEKFTVRLSDCALIQY